MFYSEQSQNIRPNSGMPKLHHEKVDLYLHLLHQMGNLETFYGNGGEGITNHRTGTGLVQVILLLARLS